MTKAKLILLSIVIVLSLSATLFNAWQSSIKSAVSTSLAAQTVKHSAEIKRQKQAHRSHIKKLKAKHKKELAKVKAKEKAKAKVQRAMTAVPVLGIAALSLIEKREYDEWLEENPGKSFEDYSLEISRDINELLNEEYQSWQEQTQSGEYRP